jgi:hypothetical protein
LGQNALTPTNEAVAKEGFGATDRRDAWWVAPVAVAAGLGVLGLYLTWAAAQNAHFRFGGYLSPVYSPEIHPVWWPLSPAFLILIPPLLFRTTCYYYRKAYYRAFFWDPPACGVGEMKRKYAGEAKFPFLLQNMHRFALYLALFWLLFLWRDVWDAFFFQGRFGIGIGSLAILASTGTLTLYTTSCHSWRHIVGGKLDCFSCSASSRARHGIWQRVTLLNEGHQLYAWVSLFAVTFADLYIRLLSMGVIHDVRLL